MLVLATLLAVAGLAQADHGPEDHNGINSPGANQHLSKRPYAAPVAKTEIFEGAVVENKVEQPKKLRLHMFDRRPYMEKAAD